MTDTTKTPERVVHASLVEALAAAQGEFGKVGRNREGQEGNRRFKYGDLSAILAAVAPALSRHGIAHTTRFDFDEAGGVVLISELRHSGETLASRLPVAVQNVNIMQAGKNISYLRRYALQALLDICPEDEDQDGDDLGDARQPAKPPQQTKGQEGRTAAGPAPRQRQANGNGGPKPTTDGRGFSLRIAGEPEPLGPFATPRDACGKLYRLMAGSPDADGMNAAEIRENMGLNKAVIDAAGPEARQHMEALLEALGPEQGAAA